MTLLLPPFPITLSGNAITPALLKFQLFLYNTCIHRQRQTDVEQTEQTDMDLCHFQNNS